MFGDRDHPINRTKGIIDSLYPKLEALAQEQISQEEFYRGMREIFHDAAKEVERIASEIPNP